MLDLCLLVLKCDPYLRSLIRNAFASGRLDTFFTNCYLFIYIFIYLFMWSWGGGLWRWFGAKDLVHQLDFNKKRENKPVGVKL